MFIAPIWRRLLTRVVSLKPEEVFNLQASNVLETCCSQARSPPLYHIV